MTRHGVTTKMRVERHLGARMPGTSLVRGWHLAGAGPARFGWGAVHPAGRVQFLGKSIEDIARRLGLGQAR